MPDGLYSAQRRSDRQPQPMRLVSVDLARSSSAIFPSSLDCPSRVARVRSARAGALSREGWRARRIV
ncbi:MAG TPA: hypothetical protein VKV80_22045 [Streptosporangiaceae bacterium]|nr:hypothetical protein [Streptosporangiaceae bacterium]